MEQQDDEKAVDAAKLSKRLRTLAKSAEGDLADALNSLADDLGEPEDEEMEEAPPEKKSAEPEFDLEELAGAIAKQFDVQLAPLAELQEQVKALQAQVAGYKQAEDRRRDAETPRFVLSLEKRASQADETVLEEGDPLLKMKPQEATPSKKSGADHFFATKK
jgi:hypothetical protein